MVAPSGAQSTMSDEEIHAAISQREGARRQRDFESADRIRSHLRAHGVSVSDTEKVWTAIDGRRGSE